MVVLRVFFLNSLRPLTKRPLLVFPVFLDVEAPLPGQVVMLIIISKLGFDVVLAAGHQAFWSLLQRGQEVIVGGTRPIAAHHVVRLINCQRKTADSQRDVLRICTFSVGESCSLTLHSFPVRLLHVLQTRNDLPVHL